MIDTARPRHGRGERWSEEERRALRELAAVHNNDRTIARLLRRKPTAVSWQRRYLRIRLGTAGAAKVISATRMSSLIDSYEPDARVRKLMDLSFGQHR